MAVRRGLLPQEHFGSAQYLRMSLNERIQHGLMAGSFLLLVITGFMLRYPDAWWVVLIRSMSENAFEFRSLVHRIAGVVMMGISAYHLGYVASVKRGKRLIMDLLPRIQDARDAWMQLRFYVGLSRQKPRFHRFGYVEKAEYWALVWGVFVMAATGFVLWFDNYFMNLLTKAGWDIARTIHYYEAILATLAIIVWHFYFVIFNPDVYPMNTAWLNGMLAEEEMEKEHPLELEELRAQASADL
jgi:cytochrome b subunit of formate dehydrogenase